MSVLENLNESYVPRYFEVNGSKLAVIAYENEFGIAEADKAGTAV